MRSLFCLLCSIVLFVSCDDGDIIVTDFDFEDSTLQLCGDTDTRVLYKVNNGDVFESISFEFQSTEFTGTSLDTFDISLNQNNQLTYRTYDSDIEGSNYFCVETPPTEPDVRQEFVSTNGGTASFTPRIIPNADDEDGDGLTNAQENRDSNQDTDQDGIPDYQDIDDDNDNVPTSSEATEIMEGVFTDTDEDGVPNYLDNDDDGDGVLTRFEDADMNLDPRNDQNADNVPFFLDNQSVEKFIVEEFIPNTYEVSIRTQIIFTNLTFDGGDVQAIEGTYDLGRYEANQVEITVSPSN